MQAVNNFKNETGYTKHARKLVQNSAPPPPRLQLLRHSRQQDPLVANASTSAPSTTTQVQAPTPTPAPAPEASPPTPPHVSATEGQVASCTPPAADHHSPPKSINHGEPPPPG